MNWLKLQYVRWKNKSKWMHNRMLKKITVEDIFYNIKPTNTYIGMVHNFLKIYKATKMNPNSKILKKMVNATYLNLFSMRQRWKFAKISYKMMKERFDK